MNAEQMKMFGDGFIFSGGEMVSKSSPMFESIVIEELKNAAAKVDPESIPHWSRKNTFSHAARPETRGSADQQKKRVKPPQDLSSTTGKNRNDADEDFSHVKRGKRSSLDGTQKKIPDTKTRNLWLKNIFASFSEWKQNGENEEQRPRYDVSTWTGESVFRFLQFFWKKSARSRAKTSADFTDSTESVEGGEIRPFQKGLMRFSKSREFVSLFEKKRSFAKRKGNTPESDKSDSDDEEHCSGIIKKASAKRKGDESKSEDSESECGAHPSEPICVRGSVKKSASLLKKNISSAKRQCVQKKLQPDESNTKLGVPLSESRLSKYLKLAELAGNWSKHQLLIRTSAPKKPTIDGSNLPVAVKQFTELKRSHNFPPDNADMLDYRSLSCEQSALQTGVHLRFRTALGHDEKEAKELELGTKIKIHSLPNLISHVHTLINKALGTCCKSATSEADQIFIYHPNQNSVLAISEILDKCLIDGWIKEGTNLKMFLEFCQPTLLPETDDPYLLCLRNKLTSSINAENQNQDASCLVHATVYYQKLLSTYIALNSFEESISGGCGQTEMTEQCLEHFKRICQDVPENLSESFSPKTQLCISCWVSLTFQCRARLKLALFKTSVFKQLSTCSLLFPETGKQLPDFFSKCIDPLMNFSSVTAIRDLLITIRHLVNGGCTLDLDSCTDSELDKRPQNLRLPTRSDIVLSCKITWLLEQRSASENILNNVFKQFHGNDDDTLNFRKSKWKSHSIKKYVGPMDSISDTEECQYNADMCFDRIMRHVQKYSFSSPESILSVLVTCEDAFLPEVTLMELGTLKANTWISSKILRFGLNQHALSTGACCEKFPVPLIGGPMIYYADTWFFYLYVQNKRTWKYGTKWEWLIAPTFVDNGHFITLAVSFTKKIIGAYDSMGIPRSNILKQLQLWIQSQGVDATEIEGWVIKQWQCPAQGNCSDCAVFTFLASAYLPVCMGDGEKLFEFYQTGDADNVRGLLAQSIIKQGEMNRLCKWELFPSRSSR